ncbi:MAG: transposase, partial [Myxococcales bacterium]|nr:transposase [Myxococcales bacterium]
RAPEAVVHNHGAHFAGQFARQLRVLEIEEEVTPTGLPSMNCYAERAIGSVRRELLRHIRVADAKELQFYLDEYRRYANTERPHQGVDGRTPEEFAAGKPEAEIIDLAEVGSRRLERRPYATAFSRATPSSPSPRPRRLPDDDTRGLQSRAPASRTARTGALCPQAAPGAPAPASAAPRANVGGLVVAVDGAGVVEDAAEEVSWDLAGGRSTPVDHPGGPSGSRVPLRTPIVERDAGLRDEHPAATRVQLRAPRSSEGSRAFARSRLNGARNLAEAAWSRSHVVRRDAEGSLGVHAFGPSRSTRSGSTPPGAPRRPRDSPRTPRPCPATRGSGPWRATSRRGPPGPPRARRSRRSPSSSRR